MPDVGNTCELYWSLNTYTFYKSLKFRIKNLKNKFQESQGYNDNLCMKTLWHCFKNFLTYHSTRESLFNTLCTFREINTSADVKDAFFFSL